MNSSSVLRAAEGTPALDSLPKTSSSMKLRRGMLEAETRLCALLNLGVWSLELRANTSFCARAWPDRNSSGFAVNVHPCIALGTDSSCANKPGETIRELHKTTTKGGKLKDTRRIRAPYSESSTTPKGMLK